ncbi:hypothetical protein ACLHDF_23695 [Priestia aryabhattai]|uniref:hypothetical protein n=1 Tax=Priestia megaterium TaxID=1404 RepID=UPI0039B878FB
MARAKLKEIERVASNTQTFLGRLNREYGSINRVSPIALYNFYPIVFGKRFGGMGVTSLEPIFRR